MLRLIETSIDASILALGDAIVDVTVAEEQPVDVKPGEDYNPSYQLYTGKGVFENVSAVDYPETQIKVGDQTLLLMKCEHDVVPHEFVKVGDTTYHVYDVRPDIVGHVRVLQKLLVREEPKEIEWESGGPVVSFTS